MVKNKQSFTLIELLVSITIIILFSGMVLAYYNQQTAYKRLAQDADKLVDILELAKKKAIAGDMGNRTTADCNFGGYSVVFNSNNYYLTQICLGDSPTIQSYTLTNAVSFYTYPTANQVVFSLLTGSNNSLQTIKLIESSLGASKAVTISVDYGNISKN